MRPVKFDFLRTFATIAAIVPSKSGSTALQLGSLRWWIKSTTLRSCPGIRASSSKATEMSHAGHSTLQILALHGSEGTADGMVNSLESLQSILKADFDLSTQVKAIDAPFPKANGYSWWTLPPGVRSFNAQSYPGLEDSTERIVQAMAGSDQPIDLVIAHSQGAILIATLLTLNKLPYHPKRGYLLNGVAFPNPVREEFQTWMPPSTPPNILVVLGEKDRINPSDTALEVVYGLDKKKVPVSLLSHPAGHSIPSDPDSVTAMAHWIATGGLPTDG